jgi:hypothetical protein
MVRLLPEERRLYEPSSNTDNAAGMEWRRAGFSINSGFAAK